MSDEQHPFEARVSTLESMVAKVLQSVENLVISVERQGKSLDRVREQRAADAKPQLGVVAAMTGTAAIIILGIVGIAGSGYVRDQTRLEGDVRTLDVQALQARIDSMTWDSTHDAEVNRLNSSQDTKIADIEGDIERLDVVLQRELANVRSSVEASSKGRHNMQQDQITEIRKRLARLEERTFP